MMNLSGDGLTIYLVLSLYYLISDCERRFVMMYGFCNLIGDNKTVFGLIYTLSWLWSSYYSWDVVDDD